MKRFHVHLGVEDPTASIGFYSNLFGAGPSVRKDDYANGCSTTPGSISRSRSAATRLA